MQSHVSDIVLSLSGRDKDKIMLVIDEDDEFSEQDLDFNEDDIEFDEELDYENLDYEDEGDFEL